MWALCELSNQHRQISRVDAVQESEFTNPGAILDIQDMSADVLRTLTLQTLDFRPCFAHSKGCRFGLPAESGR